MATEIAYKVSVETEEGGKSLKTLKQDFKDAQKELDGLTIGSQKYIDTLKKLGSVKDEIGDLNNTIKVFNPEAKMQAFGNVMGGVASGIQGAVGAMALFGVESKDTEKMLLKVQAASAFAEGIKGVMGLGDAFKDFQLVLGKTAIGQKLVTAGQWLWNAAITANPIGAIIIALAALVAGIGYFISNTNDAADVQEKLNKKLTAENEAIQKGIDLLDLKNSKLNQANQDAVALMQAQGASEADVLAFKLKALDDEEAGARKLYKEKLKIYNNDKEVYEGLRKLKKDSSDKDDIKELADEKAKLDAKFIETTKLYDSLGQYKIKGNILVAASETKDRNDTKARNEQAYKEQKAIADKKTEDAKKLSADMQEINKIDLLNEVKIIDDGMDALFTANQLKIKLAEETSAKLDKIRNDELAKEKKKQDDIIKMVQYGLDSAQALADIAFVFRLNSVKKGSKEEEKIAKQQFEVNKALQIANTVVNTIVGVRNALIPKPAESPLEMGLRIANAVSIGIGGVAAIAKISATKFGSTGGNVGGVDGGGAGGGATAPAIAPPSNGSTMLNPDGTVKAPTNQQQMIKAVVVETDITKTQRNINSIETSARL